MNFRLAAGAAWWVVGLGWVGYFLTMVVRGLPRRARRPTGVPPLRYAILIPCRNEEMVLSRTLRTVTAIAPERIDVVVIDDGSTDRTAEIARSFDRVHLVHRAGPAAGRGKGAALNAGLAALRPALPNGTVVGVIDADGRIDPDALGALDAAFADDRVGAVQMSVRIGNRRRLLGRFQDLEFVSFSHVMQAARRTTGTVGLGGNGQFVRAEVLRGLGPTPWSDCLTEDLDLGLRVAAGGWRLEFVDEVAVTQQGVDTLPALVRQRARWLQGHLQCWAHIRPIAEAPLGNGARMDLMAYLLSPLVLITVGIMWAVGLVVAATTLLASGAPALMPYSDLVLALRCALVLVPCTCLAVLYKRRSGDVGLLESAGLSLGLLIYNLVWCAALALAFWRHITGRTDWCKTARVPDWD